jgi:hypothetical protein
VTTLPILFAGIVLLLLCVRLVVQMFSVEARSVTQDDFAKARQTLDSMLIKKAVIKRILADEDMHFISHSGSNELQSLFIKERKMLALHWFRTIQQQVAYLIDIHLRLAACTTPSPRSELKLSAQYWTFVLVSNCLVAAFWLFGPFNARRSLAYILHIVEHFFSTFRDRFEVISPAQLGHTRESLLN